MLDNVIFRLLQILKRAVLGNQKVSQVRFLFQQLRLSRSFMSEVNQVPSIGFSRRRTFGTSSPYESISWERREASITNWSDGSIAFQQHDVEFPARWSATASNIVSQKYFRGELGTDERLSLIHI